MPTNPNDPTEPSTLDGSGFPFRHVALFCDECEEVEVKADVRADTQAQAFAGLRRIAADQGWLITARNDVCPGCRATNWADCPGCGAECDQDEVCHCPDSCTVPTVKLTRHDAHSR